MTTNHPYGTGHQRDTRFAIAWIEQGPNGFRLHCTERGVVNSAPPALTVFEKDLDPDADKAAAKLDVLIQAWTILEEAYAAHFDAWANEPGRRHDAVAAAVKASVDLEATKAEMKRVQAEHDAATRRHAEVHQAVQEKQTTIASHDHLIAQKEAQIGVLTEMQERSDKRAAAAAAALEQVNAQLADASKLHAAAVAAASAHAAEIEEKKGHLDAFEKAKARSDEVDLQIEAKRAHLAELEAAAQAEQKRLAELSAAATAAAPPKKPEGPQ